jgi:hypothetical protein
MKPIDLKMNAAIDSQRLNISFDGIQKAIAQPRCLKFVEQPTVPEIIPGRIKEPDIHEARP